LPPGQQVAPRRVKARVREVVLAAMLTLAAIGFIAAAMLRGDGPSQPSGVETARKPSGN